jgi:hypothetical protein
MSVVALGYHAIAVWHIPHYKCWIDVMWYLNNSILGWFQIALFQKEHGKDSTFMPTRKSLERAGRYDLARSLEKWGGLQEVARVLGLKVRKRQKSQCSERQPPQFQKPTVEDEISLQLPRKTSLPLKSTKWIMMWRGSRSEGTDL